MTVEDAIRATAAALGDARSVLLSDGYWERRRASEDVRTAEWLIARLGAYGLSIRADDGSDLA